MIQILMVGLGGFLGSVSRYLVTGLAQKISNNPFFPYGTMTVNIIGCFLIGLMAALVQNKGYFGPNVRLFIMVGFIGGFTTFSTFSNETLSLITDGQFFAAAINIIASVGLGLFGVWFGYVVVNLI
ncbi:MAG TPA: fluoride efflux transporter CrcB [Sedimentisphaerales bacterium]|nr:fluoride efflux transporter CrcB [Sedimentisphaerales bacterium]